MTTADANIKTPRPTDPFRLPDPPEHPDDKMTSFKQLSATGHAHHLAMHLGNPDTTLVTGERYVVIRPTQNMAGSHYPDLLVAFDVDPAAYEARNGYAIEEQGKAPDFVLEIASARTGHIDVGEKRDAYAALGITEYWRFDETGQHHGARLAGDRLVDGMYEPIPIEELDDGISQGYSMALNLNLNLRWEDGQLRWHDPATGRHIPTYEDQRNQADYERARADSEQTRADNEQTRADNEHQSRLAAEDRVRELEAELQRLRQG